MSGIYIPGMEMPETCAECIFCRKTDSVYAYCYILSQRGLAYIPDKCPLIPVPDHGRLIDADALGEFPYNMDFCDGGEVDEWVRNAPTIISADVDKEG